MCVAGRGGRRHRVLLSLHSMSTCAAVVPAGICGTLLCRSILNVCRVRDCSLKGRLNSGVGFSGGEIDDPNDARWSSVRFSWLRLCHSSVRRDSPNVMQPLPPLYRAVIADAARTKVQIPVDQDAGPRRSQLRSRAHGQRVLLHGPRPQLRRSPASHGAAPAAGRIRKVVETQ